MLSTTTTVSSVQEITNYLINATSDLCALRYKDDAPSFPGPYCNWTWDGYSCWPFTPANGIVRQKCPSLIGLDVTKYVERQCDADGNWAIRENSTRSQYPNGWTNFTPCYTDDMKQLLDKLGNEEAAQMKLFIAENTRILEIFGLSMSLISLILSLAIFCNIRNLQNARTRIHNNLFVAMIIQVVIRLTLYIDQAIIRNGNEMMTNKNLSGIQNTPFLCEGSYVLLEYARTSAFLWMFIEGLYLNSLISVSVFQSNFPYMMYAALGWGLPILMTSVWAIFTAQNRMGLKCWWGYNFTAIYWIVEGPRLAMLLVNFVFLLNIIRVLILKLRRTNTSEMDQARKAVRAAIFLIPLLGITNILNMTEAPLDRTPFEFALWSYTTHFLTSFQGFFIATLYCFLNNEVQTEIIKNFGVYMSHRGNLDWIPTRNQSAAYAFAIDAEQPANMSNNNKINNRQTDEQRKLSSLFTLCFQAHKRCTASTNARNNARHQLPETAV